MKMNSLPLLVGLTLMVILQAHVNAVDPDYSKICEQCLQTVTFPECSTIGSSHYNRTIQCSHPEENPCILGIVEANDVDTICLINNNNQISEGLADNAIGVISTNKPEIGQTMIPLPLALQPLSETSLHFTQVESFNKPLENEAVNGKIELSTEQSIEANETLDSNPSEVSEIKDEAQLEAQEEIHSEVEAQEEAHPGLQEEPQQEGQDELQSEPQEKPETQEEEQQTRPEAQEEQQPEVPDEALPGVPDEALPEVPVEPQPEADDAADTETEEKPMDYQADSPDQASDDAAQSPEIESNKIDEKSEENAVTEMATETEKETVNAMDNNSEETQMNTVESNENVENDSAESEGILKCFGCISSTDASCIVKPFEEINCKTMENQKNGCYTLFKDNGIQRGCTAELDAHDIAACLNVTNKACLSCVGSSNCNNEPWPQCFNCEPNESNRQCADQSSKDYDVMICSQYDAKCINRYDEITGATLRGCAVADDSSKRCECEALESCRTCVTPLCNGDIFEAMHRRCHQCAGTDACAVEQEAKNASPCPMYKAYDGCYFYVNATGQMQRGCISSASEYEGCKASGDKCFTCTVADACNSTPLWLTPKLTCSHCDSRIQNTKAEAEAAAKCAWAQSMETVRPCTHKYLYYLKESCQMIHQQDMEWTVRGCSLDVGACEHTMSEWCQTCSTDACNTVNLKWEYCVQCNSSGSDETSSSCSRTADHIKPSKCGASMQSYALRGCYTSSNFDTNVTTRGCISDLSEEDMSDCKKTNSCILCYESGCNTGNPPAIGTATKPFISLLSTLIVVLLKAVL